MSASLKIDTALQDIYRSWTAAVRAFELFDRALLDQVPSDAQIQSHQKYLTELLKIGRLLEAGLAIIDPNDLLRAELSTKLAELEETTLDPEEISHGKN